MRHDCHNNRSNFYGTLTPAIFFCDAWHKSFFFPRQGAHCCFQCTFWGKEGKRLQALFDYIHPTKKRIP